MREIQSYRKYLLGTVLVVMACISSQHSISFDIEYIRYIHVATDVLSKDDTLQDRTAIPVEDIVDLLDFLF